jgi:hypothetical protein
VKKVQANQKDDEMRSAAQDNDDVIQDSPFSRTVTQDSPRSGEVQRKRRLTIRKDIDEEGETGGDEEGETGDDEEGETGGDEEGETGGDEEGETGGDEEGETGRKRKMPRRIVESDSDCEIVNASDPVIVQKDPNVSDSGIVPSLFHSIIFN